MKWNPLYKTIHIEAPNEDAATVLAETMLLCTDALSLTDEDMVGLITTATELGKKPVRKAEPTADQEDDDDDCFCCCRYLQRNHRTERKGPLVVMNGCTFGKYLRILRKHRGLTQKQLGLAMGFPAPSAEIRVANMSVPTDTPSRLLLSSLQRFSMSILQHC